MGCAEGFGVTTRLVTATPMRERPTKLREVDLSLVTVLALSWFAAAAATSFTLWLLVGVLGSS